MKGRIFWPMGRRLTTALALFVILTLILAACNSSTESEDDHMAETEAEHGHEEEQHGDTGMMMHAIPEDAAAMPNPIAATEASLDAGAALFTANCAVCHGETGLGDGPSAAGLDPRPANLTESHVQELSDGALFFIISNGVEDTGMPAWDETLSDEQIWHLVNIVRSLRHD